MGTQSASRALLLLRHIGAQHSQGLRLTDLIALTGLDKSTIHRLLACLMEEGFIERVPGAKSYRLGIESVQLGLVAPDMAPLVGKFRPAMMKIARICEESVFLVARSGHYAVCVHKESGAFASSMSTVHPGTRRVLGVSAVGVSILANEHDDELTSTYRQNAELYECMGMSLNGIHKLVDVTREKGFSEMTSFGPLGTSGVGYAFPVSDTTHIGISIAGSNMRMDPQRRLELGRLLRVEMNSLSFHAPQTAIADGERKVKGKEKGFKAPKN